MFYSKYTPGIGANALFDSGDWVPLAPLDRQSGIKTAIEKENDNCEQFDVCDAFNFNFDLRFTLMQRMNRVSKPLSRGALGVRIMRSVALVQ